MYCNFFTHFNYARYSLYNIQDHFYRISFCINCFIDQEFLKPWQVFSLPIVSHCIRKSKQKI